MNKKQPSVLRGTRGEYLVFLQFALLLAFIFIPAWNTFASPAVLADLYLPRWGLLILCVICALLLGGFGAVHIWEYLTPLPYPVEHNRLVQHGVYRIVRHPLYSSQLFAGFGWTAFSLSLSHLILLAIGFLFFDYKASKEEHWLQQRHPEYEDYARRVKKFIPWVY